MKSKEVIEQEYLKAAACLCAEMYGKGCKAIKLTINRKPVIVDTAEVITYLAGKIEEVCNEDRSHV